MQELFRLKLYSDVNHSLHFQNVLFRDISSHVSLLYLCILGDCQIWTRYLSQPGCI